MATGYSTNLELALPVQGELSGTWGNTVNNGITEYLDAAIAGSQIISGSQTAVTLTNTNGDASASNIAQAGSGATGTAQYQIIRCTGNPAGLLTITISDTGIAGYSKTFVIINATSTSQSVKIVGSGPTTGITVVSGDKALVAWNGSDFVRVGASAGGSDTQVQFNSSGNLAGSANLTFNGTALTANTLTPTNALGAAYGGTGLTTTTPYSVVFSGTTATGLFQAAAGPGTATHVLTSNGAGALPTFQALPAGGVTTFNAGTTGFTPNTATSGAITLAGTLAVANGGTGQTSYTDGELLIGNTTGNTLAKATLTQGTGITITNGAGTITIASSGGGGGGTGSNLYLAVNFGGF